MASLIFSWEMFLVQDLELREALLVAVHMEVLR